MKLAIIFLATAVALSACPADAAQISPLRYDYLTGNSGSYPDSSYQSSVDGSGELLDGVTFSPAWAGSSAPPSTVVALVGWQNRHPSLRFTFDQPVTIDQVVAYFADSNGAAGVGLPVSILLSTPGGFSQSFAIDETPFAGATAPITLDGFSIVTNEITLTAIRRYQWTMLSEVQFFQTVPEPASWLLILAAGTLRASCFRVKR